MKYCRANGVRSGPGQGPSLQQQQQQKPQQPQPQIRMSLKHSSATGVKRTRCCCCWLCALPLPTSPSVPIGISNWRLRQISTTLRWTNAEWTTSTFRLCQIVVFVDFVVFPAPSQLRRGVGRLNLQAIFVYQAIPSTTSTYCPARRKPKPVWPINTSITTQLLTLPPDTDYLGGPARSSDCGF